VSGEVPDTSRPSSWPSPAVLYVVSPSATTPPDRHGRADPGWSPLNSSWPCTSTVPSLRILPMLIPRHRNQRYRSAPSRRNRVGRLPQCLRRHLLRLRSQSPRRFYLSLPPLPSISVGYASFHQPSVVSFRLVAYLSSSFQARTN
jgi:hypothetical protein